MDTIITIGREFGSGGHEVGLRLAKALQIPYYDKLLVSMVAEEGQFAQSFLEEMDEKADVHIAPFLAAHSSYIVYQKPMSDQIFLRQAEIIRRLAEEGACVIVGRCADTVLSDRKNVFRVFIYGALKNRAERKSRQDPGRGMDADALKKYIKSMDRRRAGYYRHYTGKAWGDKANYDLCVSTDAVGIDGAVNAICACVREKENAASAAEAQLST